MKAKTLTIVALMGMITACGGSHTDNSALKLERFESRDLKCSYDADKTLASDYIIRTTSMPLTVHAKLKFKTQFVPFAMTYADATFSYYSLRTGPKVYNYSSVYTNVQSPTQFSVVFPNNKATDEDGEWTLDHQFRYIETQVKGKFDAGTVMTLEVLNQNTNYGGVYNCLENRIDRI